MLDVACSASARKLFGPPYFASNDGCHCVTTFSCPEIHQRALCEWGSMVDMGSSGGEPSADGSPARCAWTRDVMHNRATHRETSALFTKWSRVMRFNSMLSQFVGSVISSIDLPVLKKH